MASPSMDKHNLWIWCDGLRPEVRIDGRWLSAEAARDELGVVLTQTDGTRANAATLRLRLENRSNRTLKLGAFRWRRSEAKNDFLATPGRRLRIYLEGWTMASPGGSVGLGDRDFAFNPEYKPFAVCAPEDQDADTPNLFRAEHLVAVQDRETGTTLVVGFITSADQYGRFRLRLDEDGVAEFEAIADADDREVPPGEAVDSEELALLHDNDGEAALCAFARLWGHRMGARLGRSAPTGWCSWYHYFHRVTENDILENVRFFARHRDEYPIEYLQLDDGYQTALGDWLTTNDRFPGGLAALADAIKKEGFKPALWVGAFMVGDDSELLRRHPEWMLRTPAGEVCFPMKWRGGRRIAVLDGTHPEVQDHFRRLFREIRAIGFEYVKLDFMMLASCAAGSVRHDPRSTRAQALRRGLAAIREGFGDDGFILGCTMPFGPSVGLVDGERIATDITPYWKPDGVAYSEAPTVPNVCRNVVNRAYMHRRLWQNDPDVLIARDTDNRLTDDEVKLWRDALRLTGGMLFLGDRMPSLSPERVRLTRDLLREADAYAGQPLDRWERTPPERWRGTHRETGEQLLGYFNFGDTDKTIEAVTLPPHSSIVTVGTGKS